MSQEAKKMIVDSIILSTILEDKFETMVQKGYVLNNVKQSVKNSGRLLSSYLSRVFGDADKDILMGATVVSHKAEMIEKILSEETIYAIDDRKGILREILKKHGIFDNISNEIVKEVDKQNLFRF